ncbi:cAMP-binding domain of CRP or a regulatory subunit of cAMP-dependent protein kinases [Marinactinospora thermotolerans DSM 45154]|uniref:cAMP-binding domain of CRP or a regulatory subunit of cAMP-dependent protein kinases n=2 Tax=Marinactinospora thermotolerans TaxID=531310 RepID=A0A1T4RTB3_9ACTN|nr:cAMP-binding domain of CRP or a regulatory subunit of cAMP-dependent protein kinases [Marinactinospora thermotolerans DSM 45154]
MRQGDPGGSVHLLVEGRVKVTLIRPDGEEVMLIMRTVGEALGEMSVISGRPRTATVTSVGPSQTRMLTEERFRDFIRSMELEPPLLRHLVERQNESDLLRAEQVTLPAGRRLAAALLRLSRLSGEPIEPGLGGPQGEGGRGVLLRLGLSQRELGESIGLSRTSVAVEFTRLREIGLIRTGRQYVAVLDVERLRQLAEGDVVL